MTFRSGFVNIIGPPNSGKSTLINQLIGSKVSIVSPKAQTTRFSVRGILNVDIDKDITNRSQIIFVDTPGIFEPKRKLDQFILNNTLSNIKGADHSIFIYDSKNKKGMGDFLKTLKIVNFENKNLTLVLNKIDQVEKKNLLLITDEILKNCCFSNVFMISALNGDGCNELKNFLAKKMPIGNFLYDEKQKSNLSDKLMASEITREKLFKHLSFEIPYNLYVETNEWQEKKNEIKIYQNIIVPKSSHKMIIIGKNGENIKKIGKLSRQELSQIFDKKIHLFLFIRVKKNWTSNDENYKFFGMNIDA